MDFRVILPLAIFLLHHTVRSTFPRQKSNQTELYAMKTNRATAITIFFFHRTLLSITEKTGNFFFLFSFTYIFLCLNEKYYIPFEGEFIQEDNATKFTFLFFSFILYEYLCQHNSLFIFHHITQYLSYLNKLDFDFDYTSLKYNHWEKKKQKMSAMGRSLEWFQKIIFLRSCSPAQDPRRLGMFRSR